METLKTKSDDSKTHHELGDEMFMSAAELRDYMVEMQMAKAGKSVDGMDRAEQARQDLVKRMSEPLDLTPERLNGDHAATQSQVKVGGGARPDRTHGDAVSKRRLHGQGTRHQ